MAIKHHNQEYDGGSPDIPLALGDRYYSQDLGRDFNYLRNLVGKVLADLGQTLPALVSGGVVTKGTGDTLNITPAVGYANHEVDVPDAFSSIPPAVIQEDVVLRVESTQQTNMAVPGATLDGSTVNYVKLRYAETDVSQRARAKKAGTYYYEQSAGFSIVVNPTANTGYDVLLATFTGTPGGAFNITQADPALNIKGYMIDWGAGADEVDADLMPLGTALTHAPTGGTAANLTATSKVRAAFQKVLDLLVNLSGVGNNAVVNRHIGPAAVKAAEVDFGVGAGQINALSVPNLRLTKIITTAGYTITDTDGYGFIECSPTALRTVTLPAAANNNGRIITIQLVEGFDLTIDTTGAETINKAPDLILYYDGDWVSVRSNGTEWCIVGEREKIAAKTHTVYTWTGAIDMDWTNGGNWNPTISGGPRYRHHEVLIDLGDTVVMDSLNVQELGELRMNHASAALNLQNPMSIAARGNIGLYLLLGSTIDLNGFALTVFGRPSVAGGTVTAGAVTMIH